MRRLPRPLDLLAAAGVGYFAGTVPSADAVTRLAAGDGVDLRRAGSGNPGAANAMDVLGKGWGYGILFADMAKGWAACATGRRLAGPAGANVAGAAAVIGHCFPVWSKFRGGKGVAVSAGQCLATFPAYFPIDIGVAWAVGHWKKRALPATAAASVLWVAAGFLWWRKKWPNLWGPEPGPALPLTSAVTATIIWFKFATARRVPPLATPPGAAAG
jgi:glycerol-3-phosphate acyltransferase PlsY